MKRFTLLKTNLTLATFAVAMIICATQPDPPVRAIAKPQAAQPAINDSNLILFKRGALDTRASVDTTPADLLFVDGARKQTRILQFYKPIKRAWLARLAAAGLEIVGYLPHNAYIVRGNARQLARAATLGAGVNADEARPVRWMGRFDPVYKIDPRFDDELLTQGGDASVDVEIELLDAPESAAAVQYINEVGTRENRAPRRFLNFIVLSASVPVERLLTIAAFDETLFIGPASHPELHDERSAQIVAANLSPDGTQPAGPGYREWLTAKGLDAAPNFIIDVTDSGLDRGSTVATSLHPDFHDAQGNSRVEYNVSYAASSGDRSGHGTLMASILGGLGADERVDGAGYRYGLGIDPSARLGASRIFEDNGRLTFQLSFTTVVSATYANGARISNNSWGQGGNSYDASAQEYDARVRDAQPDVPGNQEMVVVFSAGNNGAGGRISSPGTAKNVITVAAGESFRPEGSDSCNLDGGGAIGPEGANSALDILRFSSGGPTGDGRAKPDITAPGTHIYGAASQAPDFRAGGLCPGITIYQPPGQRFYTWSSGTSLAAAHVTGAASLLRRFFERNQLPAPSPAMTKAYLVNSALYMTGENAGGNLPSERQGWGLVNLARALEDADRSLTDQTHLFTESGQTFEIQGSLADRSQPLRVTLAWTDAPGMLAGAAIVNDLDLEVTIGGVTVYRGNNFAGDLSFEGGNLDRLNNVESLTIPASAFPEGHTGNFTVTVRAANIAGDGVPGNVAPLDQDFALVVYNIGGAIEPPPPPPPAPAITNATYLSKVLTITGRDFTAAAKVEINGQTIDRTFTFNAATNSLSIKKKARKLKLNTSADNQIVLIENNRRSLPFTLRL